LSRRLFWGGLCETETAWLLIQSDLGDRYGPPPLTAPEIIWIVELKQIAKSLDFSRIKPEAKQYVILETSMEEPGWNLLAENLPEHLRSRFVYSTGKVTVRGLGMLKADRQLEHLIEWLAKMQGALPLDTLPIVLNL
jgi:transcription-repair coupling factor (superfamily II helicase)